MAQDRRQLSLNWQFVLLVICVYLGHRLTKAYGERLANSLGIEFYFGRTLVDVFFAAVVAIVGVLAYQAIRRLPRG